MLKITKRILLALGFARPLAILLTTASAILIGGPSLAVAGSLFGVIGDGSGNGLVEINVTDASTTALNPLGNGDDGEGIAYNPNTGLLYHTSGIDDGEEFFETIDPSASFAVGPNLVPGSTYGPDPSNEITAIEWYQPLGVFLAMDFNEEWFHITPGGAFTDVGDYDGAGAKGFMRGLAVVGNRVFSISPDDDDDFIEELDPANGNVLSTINFTVDGSTGRGGTGLAYDPDTNTIYGIVRDAAGGNDRLLATLDLGTGDFTTIGTLPAGIAGITVIPRPVPEPSTFGLGAAGLLLSGWVRRRRSQKPV